MFAADHGIAAQGVSAYPQEVTAQMVLNMLAGGAAVSVLARQHGLALTVVDCGVRGDIAAQSGLRMAKVARGSADASERPAMTRTECDAALGHGVRLLGDLPGNALLLGEMGIGNTSAAALLMSRLTGLPIEACAGRGTGLADDGYARKLGVLHRALDRHAGTVEPLDVLAALGGLEIATLAGAVLQRCVFAHCSAESGHARWLSLLGAVPLLDLGLRLGEGSGAALAWPLLRSAELLLAEMASFDSAGVSERGA